MARLLYYHVDQLPDMGYPGKGHDLGQRKPLCAAEADPERADS